MIYFTSDLHLDHENIIKYENRPFKNVDEMNSVIINNINKVCNKKDELYILGDIALSTIPKTNELISQIECRKYLIKGNHDSFVKKQAFNKNLFEWIKNYHELKYNGKKFILSHYPFQSWNGSCKESIHLHGHVHSRGFIKIPNRYNVGQDVNEFKPVCINKYLRREINGK